MLTSFLTCFVFRRTGDLLLDPVLPDNVFGLHIFVNEESRDWFEAQEVRPTGSFASSASRFADVEQVREAVAEWVCAFIFLFSF